VGSGFSPLDDELALLPGACSPLLEQGIARCGALLPFRQAAEHLAFFWEAVLSPSTVRRHTEAAGAAATAVQTAAVERLEQACPAPPVGPERQQVSADGAMVPLVGGVYAEVKTLAIARLTTDPSTGQGRAVEPSYFSRLTDHQTFSRLAYGEVYRRGTETAATVVGVMDGAAWLQQLLDRHRPDAVRILDQPHALEHLAAAATASFGAEDARVGPWLAAQHDALEGGAPSATLVALHLLPVARAADPAKAQAARDQTFGYLASRLEQIRYADFRAQGYPIGSGLVESANKLVVEARLKGSGMHWQRPNVNPLLALRNLTANQRWDEAWPELCAQLRRQRQRRAEARRQATTPAAPPPPVTPAEPAAPAPAPVPPPPRPLRVVAGRPTAEHPWRRPFLRGGRERAAS
jgi:hypothetical protein